MSSVFRLPLRGLAAVFVFAAYSLAGCEQDSIVGELVDPCPRGPYRNEVDYFPLEEGRKWSFEVINSWISMTGFRPRNGTLTWTVLSDSTCILGRRLFVVEEVFESTEGQARRNLVFEVTDDLVINETYMPDGIRRFFRHSTADTIEVHTRSRPHPSGSFVPTPHQLVRNRGLVKKSYFVSAGVMAKHWQSWNLID